MSVVSVMSVVRVVSVTSVDTRGAVLGSASSVRPAMGLARVGHRLNCIFIDWSVSSTCRSASVRSVELGCGLDPARGYSSSRGYTPIRAIGWSGPIRVMSAINVISGQGPICQ